MSGEKWIVGQSALDQSQLYLIHNEQPVFVARIRSGDDPDSIAGLGCDIGEGVVLNEFHVYGDTLSPDELVFGSISVIRAHPLVLTAFRLND